MFNKSIAKSIPVVLASALLISACAKKPNSEEVVVEEDIIMKDGSVIPEWVVDQVVPIPAAKAPGVAEERPSTDHVWVTGEWKRDGDKWVWEKGRWVQPPTRHASWMSGHWRLDGKKWHWTPGHWVVTNRPYYVDEPPLAPALLEEVRPEKPSEHNHWIAGYWDWDGHWYWVPGYWTSKPNPDAEWVAGRWDKYGIDGGYRWIGGHWRIKY